MAKSCIVVSARSITKVQKSMLNSNSLESLTGTQMPTAGLNFNVRWQVFQSHSPLDRLVFSQFTPNGIWSFQQRLAPLCPCRAHCMGLAQRQLFPPNVLGHQCNQDNLMLWIIPRRSALGADHLFVLNGTCYACKNLSSSLSTTTHFFHSFCP